MGKMGAQSSPSVGQTTRLGEALGEAMEKSEAAGAVFKTVVRTGQVAGDLPLL
jgi:hypothetical protein